MKKFKKKQTKFKKIIPFLLIGLLSSIVFSGLTHCYLSFIPKATFNAPHILHIPKKSSVHDIAILLKKKQLIHSVNYFKLISKTTKKDHLFKAGYFNIPKSTNQHNLIYILTTQYGNHNLVKITIPEGFSIAEIATRLEKNKICLSQEFEQYCHTQAKSDFKSTFTFLTDIPLTTIEGYLFPETYFFKHNESIPTIVKTMLTQFKKQIYTPYKTSDKTYKYSFHQLTTLASMIQKESRINSEMPRISSVFYNRLKKRMRLESDPTVVYALGKTYKDKVYYKDLETKSPYNTYRVGGFPPTPIASPGTKAFKAALNPETTPYLFFVAQKNGYHHFTKTYKEHLAIQRKK